MGASRAGAAEATISIVVLTHDRCHLLRQCVENVLLRTSPLTTEIVIWNNASRDGTRAYLDSLRDPRIRVVHSPKNIGVNAYAEAFRSTAGRYLIELDDDVVDAPAGWDETLLDAFERLPHIGYLAANLVDDPHDVQARLLFSLRSHLYRSEEANGLRLKVGGPIGGWCGLTSRDLHDRVGGWRQKRRVFWEEEGVYFRALERLGLAPAYLEDLRVRHAGGPHYSPTPKEKLEYLLACDRRYARRNAVKNALLALPLVRLLNERNAWFEVPPDDSFDWVALYTTAA